MSIGVLPAVLDGGLSYLAQHCTRIVAVISFAPGDSHAVATMAGNVIAAVPVAAGEWSITDGPAGARVLNNPSKLDAAADAAGDPTHFLFLDDTTERVLRWTNETTTGAVSAGGAVTVPNVPLTSRQPTAA